ncbi:hypothetical protein Hdeb2414_s0002g00056611 [Helianthus debilis subsp. tardiflorus]
MPASLECVEKYGSRGYTSFPKSSLIILLKLSMLSTTWSYAQEKLQQIESNWAFYSQFYQFLSWFKKRALSAFEA